MTAATVTTRPVRLPAASAWQIVEYNLVAAKRYWRGVLVIGLITPLTYVLALGVGLGVVVDDNGNNLGVPYLVFVAPAFLTAAALQIAATEATFPVMAGFKWQRIYHGMAATPLTPRQICDGHLLAVTLRVLVNSAIYLSIMAAFGGTERWTVLLAIPVATLTAMAFAAPVVALAATVRAEGNAFNVLFRFVVTPMFLFSGTFYPISELPHWGQWIASVSPLWHGTELARAAGIGGLSGADAVGHVAYLVGWLVVGVLLARWRFRVRLAE
ncbi:MAG TPA: ABC transporter permease [Jatrophihabitantaceae bacterium]|nr:ABC transporter permease [Jatrophihabitantaceae bacterium]